LHPHVAAAGYRPIDASITRFDASHDGISGMATIDSGALANMFNDLSGKVEETVRRVNDETEDRPLAEAAHVLRDALAHHGINWPDDWCRNVLDTLRHGEPLVIDLD
jgi:hypothetical protein